MSERVKIKVRAEQEVQFPALCVHCARPATEWMGLRRRIGRVIRLIDVPLCQECRQQLKRRSAEEERLQTLGRVVGLLFLVLTLALVLLLTPAGIAFAWRLLIGLFCGLSAGGFVFLLLWRASRRAALPAKKEIYESACITDFSWRVTTFEFSNETFSERFQAINEHLLVEA
jgi:hypothetical protein